MAKQQFTIAHDVRFDGKHVSAGSQIELDATNERDAATLNNLLSSNRIVDVKAAHKHLADCQVELAKAAAPAGPAITPPPAAKKPATEPPK